MTDLPRCAECRHSPNSHGDRAITACMGGYRGPYQPFTVPRCPCTGYKVSRSWARKLRKAAA